jgi:hypothetical protein
MGFLLGSSTSMVGFFTTFALVSLLLLLAGASLAIGLILSGRSRLPSGGCGQRLPENCAKESRELGACPLCDDEPTREEQGEPR